MLDAHPAVPLVELLQQIRIDLEQIKRGGVRKRRRFHETQKQEQIVQFGRLLAQFVFVPAECNPVHELTKTKPVLGELVGPIHIAIIAYSVSSTPQEAS